MKDTSTAEPAVTDLRLDLPSGQVFARRWLPRDCRHDRTPVLLIHDSLGSVALWRDFPATLATASGREVIAYDRLGFGRSSPRTTRPSFDFIAEEGRDIFPLICDRLNLGSVIPCGHSVGGSMGVEAAAAHPDRAVALVTIAAQCLIEEQTLRGVAAAKVAFSTPEALQRLSRYHGDKARWVVDAWTETWLSPDFAGWSLDGALAQLSCPTLAIRGEQDEYGSPLQATHIAHGTNRKAVIIPGAGHVPHRECPDILTRIIADFLTQQP